jgi:alkylhydroperoxidase family enzyme
MHADVASRKLEFIYEVDERAAAMLSKEEIAAVEWLGVEINAWNRIAISSRYPVRP